MAIGFDDLRILAAVARAGSMRRAADHLSLAPSIVTRQIARLERHYSRPLLERRPDGVTPTAAGLLVLDAAESVLRAQADLEARLGGQGEMHRGTVRLHTIEGVTRSFLVPLQAIFRRDHPQTRLALTIAGRKLVLAAIEDYEAEIGFVYDHFSNPNLVAVATWQQPLLALLRPGHPLLREGPPTLAGLARTPCALPDETFAIRRLVESGYRARGLEPAAVLVANQLQTLIEATMSDDLVTYMPLQAARPEIARGALVPVATGFREFDYRFVSVVVHRTRPRAPHVDAFLDAVREAIPLAEAEDRALIAALEPPKIGQG